MNVTRDNFSTVYPEIKQKISTCNFMSIDEEMTGIMSSDYKQQNKKTDNPDDRYARMVHVALTYGIIQFGLCLFHEVLQPDGETVMEASPYNFYLFSDSGADMSLSGSSISFLRKNNMDFGTWISKGIPYANQNGETFLRKKYLGQAPAVSNENQRIVLTKESDIAFLSDCKAKLEAFIEDDTQIEFVFDKCNSYLRRVLYQLMEFDFPSYKVNKTATDQLQVLKLSDDARRELESKILEEGKKSFEELMGFRLVFLDMVAAKKPFIGHNCLFDFMFMMRWLDLPFKEGKMETLTDFKIKFNGLFPVVFDTKYIAESGLCGDDYASTALGDLYENIVAPVLAVKPFVRYAVGFDEIYSSGGQLHDAGWDAYCTGALFCHQLNLSSSLSYLIEKAGNKLFMMQSMFHMDIDPSQPNGFLKIKGTLLHIGNFSPDTKMDTILQVFVVGGYELTSLSMSWIDGTSTFMGINTLDTPEEVKTKITVPDGWVVKSYEEFSVPPIATDVVNENGNMENPLKRSFSAGI